ncbi:SRPBCC family protein [Streptomyces sp. NPDC096311]|uniref:SRPBCC family protein n=1 Tax=Streptomyces sp. NPDC096311 TaxID=3366083 RepID=UPI0038014C72
MSRLQEHVEIGVPARKVWDQLHRVEEYPSFMGGVRRAYAHGAHRAHLDIWAGGGERALETTFSDRGNDLAWQTESGPKMQGTLTVRSLDEDHSRVEVRMEYDPESVHGTFGGPKGMAQVHAVERTVRGDLEQFRALLEEQK